MLSLKQPVAIETQQIVPPLHVGDLHKKYGLGPLSLRSILTQVKSHNATLFVQVRDGSILKSVTNLAQLQATWQASFPSKATLVQLAQTLAWEGAATSHKRTGAHRDPRRFAVGGAT
jgi:hypothetical protein